MLVLLFMRRRIVYSLLLIKEMSDPTRLVSTNVAFFALAAMLVNSLIFIKPTYTNLNDLSKLKS